MQRLFMLCPSVETASALVNTFRQAGGPHERLRVIASRPGVADQLDVPAATFEHRTDVRNSRRRGLWVGLLVGLAVALLLTLTGLNAGLSTTGLFIAGAIGGAALGFVIGTIVGPSERHPILETHRDELEDDAVLLALDTDAEHAQEAVELAEGIRRGVRVEVRTLTDVDALT